MKFKVGDRVQARGGDDSPDLGGYTGVVDHIYSRAIEYCRVRFDVYHKCMWAKEGTDANLRDILFDDLESAAPLSPFEQSVRAYITSELRND